ncbi:hypothetical protein PLICRDRAFT_107005, partial [Plicaturopsis crispa FD-325 SS-3]
YPLLSSLLSKYPRTAGSLFQTYNDLLLAQQWTEVEVVDLQSCQRGAIKGKRPNTDIQLAVVPCSLAESLSLEWMQNAFGGLGKPAYVYLAITSDDASIVYYKISRGMVKPPV